MKTLGRTLSKDEETPSYYDHDPFVGQRRTDKSVLKHEKVPPRSPGHGFGGYISEIKHHETIADPITNIKTADKLF